MAPEGVDLPAVETPEGPISTLPPDFLEALRAAAAVDPNAEVPDEIVPLVFSKKPKGASSSSQGDLTSITAQASQLRSFAGLDHAASLGYDGLYRPPDTTLGKSGTRVLEGTNSALRLFSSSGVVLATKKLNDFFPTAGSNGVLFDPRVVYDRLGPNQRFFIVALQRNEQAQTASIFVAVSRSSAPSTLDVGNPQGVGEWCTYQINSVRDSPPTWADYPMVGVGADAFLISNDQFTFPNPGYDYKYGILRVVRKDLITNNATSCPSYSASIFLVPIQLSGTVGSNMSLGHVQPTHHNTAPSSFTGTTNPVYMVSTVIAPSSTYKVWRVRNAATGSPTVQVKSISAPGGNYLVPLAAYQPQPPGGAPLLNTRDNRVMQVAALGDTLIAVHNTTCLNPGGTFNKTCIRFVRIAVGQDANGALTAQFEHDVTFASPDTSVDLAYFIPGVAISSAQQTAVVFLASSPTMYQSAAWTVKNYIDQVFAPAVVFPSPSGSCARVSDRVGDFVGAQTNPNDLASFWLAAEYASLSGSPAACYWKTQVIQVAP